MFDGGATVSRRALEFKRSLDAGGIHFCGGGVDRRRLGWNRFKRNSLIFGTNSRRIAAMASHQSKPQKETVGRVMHEYKHGELRSGTSGKKVKNPRQAIAIALSEAGASNQQSPEENKQHLRRTKEKERRGETAQAETEGKGRTHGARGGDTRAELYRKAREQGVAGRSKMSKSELERAVGAK